MAALRKVHIYSALPLSQTQLLNAREGGSRSVPRDMLMLFPTTIGQKEQAGFSCAESPAFPLETNALLSPGILESTQGISQLGLQRC